MQSKVQSQLVITSKPMFALAFLIATVLTTTSTLMAQTSVTPPMAQETITQLITKELASPSGEQALPGFSSPVHRHDAQVSVYVLAGSVVMQVGGQKALTLGPGQSFYTKSRRYSRRQPERK
jgi:mannose-6-phosphate isomerase-like protein (cupin superfamily)